MYCVRGGDQPGIFDTWADAQRASYPRRQALGDACKLEGPADEVDMKAEKFMSVSPVSNRFAEYQAWLQQDFHLQE